ncbi:MAG: FkbM family methyltransferase [Bacteroidota bacterium]
MKSILKFFFRMTEGKIAWQRFFRRLHTVALRGMNFGNGGDFTASGELFVLKFIRSQFPEGTPLTVFDVGANIGDYSKKISEVMGSSATIHAFEPSRSTYAALQENTAGISNVILHHFGMTDVPGEMTLYKNSGLSGLSSVYHRRLDHFNISMDQQETIVLESIDNFCRSAAVTRIHFLKIDIEGNELRALNGAHGMIERGDIDFIQFEFGGCNIDSRTFFQDFFYLLNGHFRIFRIVKDGLVEITSYTENEEVFSTINYLAQKRDRR